jgi:hypothetical protein
LINKNTIKAEYSSDNARQIQALYNYERTILNAYIEMSNQLSKINNLDKSYDLKAQQVAALNRSIDFAGDLFKFWKFAFRRFFLFNEIRLKQIISSVSLASCSIVPFFLLY